MTIPEPQRAEKAIDSIQQCLTHYACNLSYADLTPEAINIAKSRVIDTLGALMSGFFAEPCRIARNVAAQMPNPAGATIIGTRLKTTPDMAAFVNGTTARYPELTDTYHWPGSFGGHPSDVVTAVLAAAEHAQVTGRELITGIVLAYEIFLRISDVFHNPAIDHTILGTLGTSVAAGKLLGLTPDQLAHCISMAAVPNVVLRQARLGGSSWKAMATGQAGRSGVFAAMLARAGMEGPHLPFEGKAGWCEHVAKERFTLDIMGGNGTPFRILDTRIKPRSGSGGTTASMIAAEKVAPIGNIADVTQVIIETCKWSKEGTGISEDPWNPQCKEAADHSIPYLVAVTLMDGQVTPHSYNDAHLWNPQLRALMQKIKLVENEEFTRAYERVPQENHTRVTVTTNSGEQSVGATGGAHGDLSAPNTNKQIDDKFRGLTEDLLGTQRVDAILTRLWHLEDLDNAATIPHHFVVC